MGLQKGLLLFYLFSQFLSFGGHPIKLGLYPWFLIPLILILLYNPKLVLVMSFHHEDLFFFNNLTEWSCAHYSHRMIISWCQYSYEDHRSRKSGYLHMIFILACCLPLVICFCMCISISNCFVPLRITKLVYSQIKKTKIVQSVRCTLFPLRIFVIWG